MAKLSDLVLCTSGVTGVPVATVREISRRLREAGLISTGSGGRYGGADMTPEDATNLLTALLIVRASAVSLNEVALLTRSYLQDLTSHDDNVGRWRTALALPQLCHLKLGHTFGDAFRALITSILNGDMERSIKKWTMSRPHGVAPYFGLTVQISSLKPYREANIEFRSAGFEQNMTYARRSDKLSVWRLPRKWSEVEDPSGDNLRVLASIQQETLKAIGLLLRREIKHG
jgi:hypothetical protein